MAQGNALLNKRSQTLRSPYPDDPNPVATLSSNRILNLWCAYETMVLRCSPQFDGMPDERAKEPSKDLGDLSQTDEIRV